MTLERVAEMQIYLQAVIPVIALTVNVVFQLFTYRFLPSIGYLKSLFSGFVAGVLLLLGAEYYFFRVSLTSYNDFIPFLVMDLVTYAALGYCYFSFLTLGVSSLRIRVMREIHDCAEGLTLEEILERYNAQEMIKTRLSRMLANKQVKEKNGRYFIERPIMLLMAKFIVFMKFLVLGKRPDINT